MKFWHLVVANIIAGLIVWAIGAALFNMYPGLRKFPW